MQILHSDHPSYHLGACSQEPGLEKPGDLYYLSSGWYGYTSSVLQGLQILSSYHQDQPNASQDLPLLYLGRYWQPPIRRDLLDMVQSLLCRIVTRGRLSKLLSHHYCMELKPPEADHKTVYPRKLPLLIGYISILYCNIVFTYNSATFPNSRLYISREEGGVCPSWQGKTEETDTDIT